MPHGGGAVTWGPGWTDSMHFDFVQGFHQIVAYACGARPEEVGARGRLLSSRAVGGVFPFEVHGLKGIRQIHPDHLVMFHVEWSENQVVRAKLGPDLIRDSVRAFSLPQ